VSITDPEGGITRFTDHDAMGNVLTKEDARGKQGKDEGLVLNIKY